VDGDVDRSCLERAVHALVARHPALRAATVSVETPTVDPLDVQRGVRELFTRPFDHTRGPLLRCALWRPRGGTSTIALVVDRAIADRRSVGRLAEQLAAAYESPSRVLPVAPDDPAPDPARRAQDLHYWTQAIGGAPPIAPLPLDRSRRPERTGRVGRQPLELPTGLEAFARTQACSLEVLFFSAFATLLHRYSDEDDFVLAVSGGLMAEGADGRVGPHENLLPLRADTSGDPPVVELLGRVAAALAAAHPHRELRLDALIEALEPQGAGAARRLEQVVQTGLVFGEGIGLSTFAGSPAKATLYGAAAPALDLTLVVDRTRDAIAVALEYNADLFDPSTPRRLAANLAVLLRGFLADPSRRLSALPIMTDAEREQIDASNCTAVDFGGEVVLHELFASQARRTPERIAVELGDTRLTYRELDERSAQLAHHLRSLGVGPDARVAVCLPRSLDMVVALLGILRAGGAYVPLDPDYPKERVDFMLDDAQVKLLVTCSALAVETSAPRVCLDEAWPQIAQHPTTPPPNTARPEHLAYVIYTSGSTGRPKGASIEHRAICNHMRWMQSAFALTAEDRVLQKTPISFDASVWEFYAPLLVGARLVMARPGGHAEIDYLATTIADSGVTVAQFVPTMLRLLLERLDLKTTPLRWLFCGGEALSTELRDRFRDARPRLVNLYGPTEACIDATFWIDEPREPRDTVPIGRPIANLQAHVLDAGGAPVPIGAIGELYLGGVGLARGYLHRPELTAERFVHSAFVEHGALRLYRTGDRVRRAPDGNLEYLGRKDGQIKLRGLRIELGEIESLLAQHRSVREAVVVVREDEPDRPRLVAYVSPKEHTPAATTAELRAHLAPDLPEFMIPGTFVPLARIPRLPSGKVDRNALPLPDPTRPELENVVPPRDMIELELLRLWQEIFGERVGVTDDFFALGGDSLQAVRLLLLVEQKFGRELPLATLLRGRTVEQLARILREQPGAAAEERWPLLVPIQQGGSPPVFLVHPSGGNVLCYVEFAHHLGTDKTVYGIQSQGLDGVTPPSSSMAEMAAHYVAAIRGVQPRGPYLLGGLSSGGMLALEMAQQIRASGDRVALLAMIEARCASSDEQRAGALTLTRNFDDAVMTFWFLVIFSRTIGIEVPTKLEEFEGLEADARTAKLLHELEAKHLMPPGTGTKQLQTIVDVFKGNIRALVGYLPQPYPDPVVLFKAQETYPQWPNRPSPPPWGWESCLSQLHVSTIPGNHFTVLHPAFSAGTALRLKPHLDRAIAELATRRQE
jgi:amino acid adenylation domain-containing protein